MEEAKQREAELARILRTWGLCKIDVEGWLATTEVSKEMEALMIRDAF